MTKIGNTIIENHLDSTKYDYVRETVRGIMIDDKNHILMAYSDFYDDYMSPGGGIKEDESHADALVRELSEEVGARGVKLITPFGYTEEIRCSMRHNNRTIRQVSYYYICHVESYGEQKLIDLEKEYGLKPVWIDIDTAIAHNRLSIQNKNHQKQGIKTVLLREIEVLKKIKETYYNKSND